MCVVHSHSYTGCRCRLPAALSSETAVCLLGGNGGSRAARTVKKPERYRS